MIGDASTSKLMNRALMANGMWAGRDFDTVRMLDRTELELRISVPSS